MPALTFFQTIGPYFFFICCCVQRVHHTVIYGEIIIGNSWVFPKDKNYCFNIHCLSPFDLALQDRVVSE